MRYKECSTRELIALARVKGLTIKELANRVEMSPSTLYRFNQGNNISKEKKEKIHNFLSSYLVSLS